MAKLCECGCGQATFVPNKNGGSNGYVKGVPMRFARGHNSRVSHPNLLHGMRHTSEYNAFITARNRCVNRRNKAFKNYGGRGIKFLFLDFPTFYAELGQRPSGLTLDRINNDGYYEPGNCRWATLKQQANNRRTHGRYPAVIALPEYTGTEVGAR